MKTVMREGPKAIAASVVGTIAPTVRPMADAAKDSAVTIPQNFANLELYKIKLLTFSKRRYHLCNQMQQWTGKSSDMKFTSATENSAAEALCLYLLSTLTIDDSREPLKVICIAY